MGGKTLSNVLYIHMCACRSADMTEQFYALHGKEYIIRQRLSREWKELLQLPNEEQTMERGEKTEREIQDRHTQVDRQRC